MINKGYMDPIRADAIKQFSVEAFHKGKLHVLSLKY